MPGKTAIKRSLRRLLDPAVELLMRLGVPPLAVTFAGLILSFLGALEIARGFLRAGGVFLAVSGMCDTLDGSLARRAGRESVFGAFIDSTVDRVAELASFGALVVFFGAQGEGGRLAMVLSLVALAGALLTSYTRARAEGLGLECRVGWIERPERMVLLIVGLLLGKTALSVVIVCLAVLTVVTFLQRIFHIRRVTAKKDVSG